MNPEQLQFARTLLMKMQDAEDRLAACLAENRLPLARRHAAMVEKWDALPEAVKLAAREANSQRLPA